MFGWLREARSCASEAVKHRPAGGTPLTRAHRAKGDTEKDDSPKKASHQNIFHVTASVDDRVDEYNVAFHAINDAPW